MPEKFNELLLKQDIIELYNAGITPDYGYLMNGRFEKDMIKNVVPLKDFKRESHNLGSKRHGISFSGYKLGTKASGEW